MQAVAAIMIMIVIVIDIVIDLVLDVVIDFDIGIAIVDIAPFIGVGVILLVLLAALLVSG